ncbi:MAG TPA: DUF1993 domain-containing protein [Caulobacteraceae bacterium]|nr:DUF1993 domain-containing protein [Caulobacteraceae bacterium]
MSATLSNTLKSTAGQVLGALCGVLVKAKANLADRNIAEEIILNDRLAPDMFPFTRQVQTATDMVSRGAARLAGVDFLTLSDDEKTLDDLILRLRKVNAFIQGADDAAIDASAQKILSIPMGPETRDFPGEAYLLNFVLPNLYFHATMAYAILRHNGVPLGKRDFLTPA